MRAHGHRVLNPTAARAQLGQEGEPEELWVSPQEKERANAPLIYMQHMPEFIFYINFFFALYMRLYSRNG